MNIGTVATGTSANDATRATCPAELQLGLALEIDAKNEDALRAAWIRSRLPMPFHVALQNRSLAICLSCLADAMQKKTGANRRVAKGARGPKRGRIRS